MHGDVLVLVDVVGFQALLLFFKMGRFFRADPHYSGRFTLTCSCSWTWSAFRRCFYFYGQILQGRSAFFEQVDVDALVFVDVVGFQSNKRPPIAIK